MNEIFKLKQIFPEVKFNWDTKSQLEHTIGECNEAIVEFEANDKDKLLIELIDVVASGMTSIYKAGYTNHEINNALQYVREKNDARGYYLK